MGSQENEGDEGIEEEEGGQRRKKKYIKNGVRIPNCHLRRENREAKYILNKKIKAFKNIIEFLT
jgi:hypothetical protein